MKLCNVLAGYRRNAGLSVRALALEIGINHSALNRFENGEEISSENLKTIIKWLLSDEEKRVNRLQRKQPPPREEPGQ
jgi:transcriptional regulator with XRE-family HTH domain